MERVKKFSVENSATIFELQYFCATEKVELVIEDGCVTEVIKEGGRREYKCNLK